MNISLLSNLKYINQCPCICMHAVYLMFYRSPLSKGNTYQYLSLMFSLLRFKNKGKSWSQVVQRTTPVLSCWVSIYSQRKHTARWSSWYVHEIHWQMAVVVCARNTLPNGRPGTVHKHTTRWLSWYVHEHNERWPYWCEFNCANNFIIVAKLAKLYCYYDSIIRSQECVSLWVEC